MFLVCPGYYFLYSSVKLKYFIAGEQQQKNLQLKQEIVKNKTKKPTDLLAGDVGCKDWTKEVGQENSEFWDWPMWHSETLSKQKGEEGKEERLPNFVFPA